LNVGFGSGGAVGTYNLSGGSLTVASANIMAIGNRGTGTVNQTGGTLYIRGSTGNAAMTVIQLGRNVAAGTGNGTFTLSGGTAAASLFQFGNAVGIAGSTNTFSLQGTGTLLTGTISIINTTATNSFNFLGGSLSATTVNIPLTNNGGVLRPQTLSFTGTGDISNVVTNVVGSMTFSGTNSYIQTGSGTLAIDIAAASVNDLCGYRSGRTRRDCDPGGTIALNLLNGFDPALGTTFDVLTADTIANTASISGTTPSGRLFSPTIVTGGDGREVLRLVVVPEPGLVLACGDRRCCILRYAPPELRIGSGLGAAVANCSPRRRLNPRCVSSATLHSTGMTTPRTKRLLDRTAGRLYLADLGWWLHRSWLAVAAICLALLLCARLLALIPATPLVQWLWVGAVVAVAAAFLLARKPAAKAAARIVDDRTGSKELFLTTALLGSAPGEFQPIVVNQAEEKAEHLDPNAVVPFRWQEGLRNVAIASLLVAAAAFWLPQLDPFKKQEQRNKVAKQEEQLRQTKKATTMRAEQLKQDEAKENDRIEKALAALQKTFKEAKPQEREANLKKLSEHQKEIGEMWRQAANQQRNDALDKATQKFGQANPQQTQQWREDLKKGDASALKKEMEAIKDQMQKLASQPESAEKRQQQEQLAQRISQMSEGLKQTASSPQLQAALQRAMEQLDMSKLSEMSKEALEAAQQSMSLSQQELEQLAQAMKDQQALEDALKNLQMAKQLAGQCQLDGEGCKDCQGWATMRRSTKSS
jgi:hypothetical protein